MHYTANTLIILATHFVALLRPNFNDIFEGLKTDLVHVFIHFVWAALVWIVYDSHRKSHPPKAD